MTWPDAATGRLTPEAAGGLWEPDGVYLNTASYGLPPRPAWDALQRALADWRRGATSWEPWGNATESARGRFARLVGVPESWVATGPAASPFLGIVAAGLPAGARVLAADGEFTSLLWPFAQDRRLRLDTVPLASLADTIDAGTAAVAVSAVQSATGELADLDAIVAAAGKHGALTIVDATQAAGWLPIDASRFDVVVCAAYKWLMSPRGTAFMTVQPSLLEQLPPLAAGWYAGEDVHASYYGLPLRLASDTRRLDTSPAWFCWVGADAALAVIEEIGVDAIHAHDVALANRFRAGLGLAPASSAIVLVERADAEARLAGTPVRAAVRAGRLRTSWHVYNTEADVEATLAHLGAPAVT